MDENHDDTRARIVDLMLGKVADDPFPSVAMMNMLEELLEPGEIPAYAAVLMQKIGDEAYPSLSMVARLATVAGWAGRG